MAIDIFEIDEQQKQNVLKLEEGHFCDLKSLDIPDRRGRAIAYRKVSK
jgi:hypothetical protein